jgi:hypothetical protein
MYKVRPRSSGPFERVWKNVIVCSSALATLQRVVRLQSQEIQPLHVING